MNRIKAYGYALLVAALLVAASMPIAFKLGSAIPTFTLLFYISLVGATTSFVMMVARGGASQLKGMFKDRSILLSVAAVGALTFTAEPLALAYATHYVSADLAAVVFRTWPVLLVVLAPFVIRERITKWDVIGVVVGFLGLAVTLIGGTAISIPIYELPFVAVLLGAALIDALSTALSKRYHYSLSASVFMYNMIALAVFAPLAIFTNSWHLASVAPGVIFSILFLGVFTQAAFAYMFYGAMRLVKTSLASTSFLLCTFLTMLLSFAFLGEAVKPYYLVIAIAVVAGVLIQMRSPKNIGNFLSNKKTVHGHRIIYDVTAAFVNTQHPTIIRTMKGSGRVLAFAVKAGISAEIMRERMGDIKEEGVTLFTGKSRNIMTGAELEFIRDIMGAYGSDTIIMGSGNPDKVARIFRRIEKDA